MKIKVYGIEIANIITNRSMTIEEAMYAAGYDINDPEDCRKCYEDGIEGFIYLPDIGIYCFDFEAAEMIY